MSKERKTSKNISQLKSEIKALFDNKYYNLWMSKYETDLDPQVFHFMFKQFWEKGEIAGFKPKHIDELAVAPFVAGKWNMYNYPEVVQLINLRNSPIVPKGNKIVNKDVVIGYCQSNRKSIKFIVDKYIRKLVNIELVINTQLDTHKLPFLVGINPEDAKKAEDIVDRILNNETVIFMDLKDLSMVKTLVNSNPYIIDKLVEYKQTVECELLTFLGLDNAVSQKVNLDITNANNDVINAFKQDIDYNIQTFVKECKEYLGVNFYLNMRQPEIQSVYEEGNQELENNTTKEGVVGGAQE